MQLPARSPWTDSRCSSPTPAPVELRILSISYSTITLLVLKSQQGCMGFGRANWIAGETIQQIVGTIVFPRAERSMKTVDCLRNVTRDIAPRMMSPFTVGAACFVERYCARRQVFL